MNEHKKTVLIAAPIATIFVASVLGILLGPTPVQSICALLLVGYGCIAFFALVFLGCEVFDRIVSHTKGEL